MPCSLDPCWDLRQEETAALVEAPLEEVASPAAVVASEAAEPQAAGNK